MLFNIKHQYKRKTRNTTKVNLIPTTPYTWLMQNVKLMHNFDTIIGVKLLNNLSWSFKIVKKFKFE